MHVSRTLAHLAIVTLAASLVGCVANTLGTGDPAEGDAHEPIGEDLGVVDERLSVGGAVASRCSTSSVRALSLQLIEELECMQPGLMSRIDDTPGISLSEAAFPYLQSEAAAALRRAVARRGGTLQVNSGLRTLPQQYLLYRWYREGRCGIGLAAAPGRSNHQSGLAIDVENYGSWRSALGGSGFRWFGSGDDVHFDYQGGTDIRGLSVLAFQRLWNRAHPEDRIAEDGDYGPSTERRLARAPSEGFSTGTSCGGRSAPSDPAPSDPAPATPGDASVSPTIAAAWTRDASGLYTFDAEAPAAVSSLEVYVEGYQIGRAARAGDTLRIAYRFMYERTARGMEFRGLDRSGRIVASGSGAIDSVPGTAVFVRPAGSQTWEIGLERPAPEVASIEVTVDELPLVDDVSGDTRTERLAVRSVLNRMGSRTFRIHTFDAAGARRGTLLRVVTLR